MDDCFVVSGGNELFGNVILHGAKNAVLPLLAASIMTDEKVTIEDCPAIGDVENMTKLLSLLGAGVERMGRRICVSGSAQDFAIDSSLAESMRSSMFMLGALLSKCGRVELPLPGGCKIGTRPLDIHFDGLKKMGAEVKIEKGKIFCSSKVLHGADISLRYPSVGATENLIMCGSLANGETTLIGVAQEPEIDMLIAGLNSMGAKIERDKDKIHIDGVEKLHGATLKAQGDRIVAGTVIAAVALLGGDILIENAELSHMAKVALAFSSKDTEILGGDGFVRVRASGRAHARDIVSAPYPAFPTDMQPQFMAYSVFSDGESKICETVFENRFAHAAELCKMGADIRVSGKVAFVRGKECAHMHPAYMQAHDLRGGAGLLIAAMKVKGTSKIFGAKYIDRGYENFEKEFSNLGAKIVREQ